jgi:hypothetical protein
MEMQMDGLLGRVGDTIYATVYGTLADAAIQGLGNRTSSNACKWHSTGKKFHNVWDR